MKGVEEHGEEMKVRFERSEITADEYSHDRNCQYFDILR